MFGRISDKRMGSGKYHNQRVENLHNSVADVKTILCVTTPKAMLLGKTVHPGGWVLAGPAASLSIRNHLDYSVTGQEAGAMSPERQRMLARGGLLSHLWSLLAVMCSIHLDIDVGCGTNCYWKAALSFETLHAFTFGKIPETFNSKTSISTTGSSCTFHMKCNFMGLNWLKSL